MAGAVPMISGKGGSLCSFLGIICGNPGEEATKTGISQLDLGIAYHVRTVFLHNSEKICSLYQQTTGILI
jgi:hypothetical protein